MRKGRDCSVTPSRTSLRLVRSVWLCCWRRCSFLSSALCENGLWEERGLGMSILSEDTGGIRLWPPSHLQASPQPPPRTRMIDEREEQLKRTFETQQETILARLIELRGPKVRQEVQERFDYLMQLRTTRPE